MTSTLYVVPRRLEANLLYLKAGLLYLKADLLPLESDLQVQNLREDYSPEEPAKTAAKLLLLLENTRM